MKNIDLNEALSMIIEMPDDHAIFAKKPFLPDSIAQIGPLDADFSTPTSVTAAGFHYVIGSISAQEAAELFGAYVPTKEEVSRFLLHYAVYDSFPDWVYEVQGE
ncbi:hypothetical protein [Lysobacter sp. Root604]|uniref:hypothetical protein n=1 Tax=Lysobacter sp. Root604 TaxID=1736568 RepID=UPI0012F92807|nr:hypothetical protein [Lysobacter sp. Root604]